MQKLTVNRVVALSPLPVLVLAAGLRAEAPAPFGQGKRVLYVNRSASKADAVDKKVTKRLRSLGFVVATAQPMDPPSGLEGADLVVIASGFSAKAVKGAYADTPVPVVLSESAILTDLGMTGPRQGVDWGEVAGSAQPSLNVVNAIHPLAAGLPKGPSTPFDGTPKLINWGKPASSAIVVATLLDEPGKAAIFGYEKGAMMDGARRAPARRVFLFLNDDAFEQLNDVGLTVFDGAMAWAVGLPSR